MCHTDIPPGAETPALRRAEVEVPLPGGETMPALEIAAAPDAPAVLVACDVFGRSPFYEHLAALLAQAGFTALVPEFFFREGPLPEGGGKEAAFSRRSRLDESRSVEDLRAAVAWQRERSSRTTVGAVGFCMGATFLLDLASTGVRDLVAVSYYGFPEPQAALTSPPPRPIDLVETLEGPVLAFWGDQDETVGIDSIERYVAAAAASNPRFTHEILPGLGHGFLGSADLAGAGDPAGATWQRALAHLHAHLDVAAGA